MPKLEIKHNKTLKLQNVLIGKIDIGDEGLNINTIVTQMQSYIKVRGKIQIGPLVQHMIPFLNVKEEVDMDVKLLLQCNEFIHSVECPYNMESVLRISDCMYCRYIGPEEKLKFAFDKINLEAFENDVELKGESYTVFVNRNEEEGTIVADVFMPKANEE